MKLLGQKYFLLIFSIILLISCTNSKSPIAELDTTSCVLTTTSSHQYFATFNVVSINGKYADKRINFLEENPQINAVNLCKVLKDAGINMGDIEAISFSLEKKKSWFSFPRRGPKPIIIFVISKQQLSLIGTGEKLYFYNILK